MKKIILISMLVFSAQSFASCFGVLYVPSDYAFITKPVEVSCDESTDDQAEQTFNALNTWIQSKGAPQLGFSDFFLAQYSRFESLDEANQEVKRFVNKAAENELKAVLAPISL